MFSTFPTTRARNTTSNDVLPPGGIICWKAEGEKRTLIMTEVGRVQQTHRASHWCGRADPSSAGPITREVAHSHTPRPRGQLPPKHYSYMPTLAFSWQLFSWPSNAPDWGNIYESATENDPVDRQSVCTGWVLLVSSLLLLSAERETKTVLTEEGVTGWRSKAVAAVGQSCFLPSKGFCGSAGTRSWIITGNTLRLELF